MKNLLFLLAIFLSTGAFAQTITYSYNEAGNRISRIYLVPLRSASTDKSNPPDSVEVKAMLGELKVIIYPNPTKGMLSVEVSGIDEKTACQTRLVDSGGRQLKMMTIQNGTTAMDMSGYPSGWYMLRVYAGEKAIDFKIIKQ